MTSGKAHGVDRDYQVLCRDVLIREDQSLSPFSDDGIDVEFKVGSTMWTVDVALRGPGNRLVIAECRRREDNVKQCHLPTLLHIAKKIHEELGFQVETVFIAKRHFQIGALKVAHNDAMQTIVCGQGQALSEFRIRYLRYDPDMDRQAERTVYHFTGGSRAVLFLAGRA